MINCETASGHKIPSAELRELSRPVPLDDDDDGANHSSNLRQLPGLLLHGTFIVGLVSVHNTFNFLQIFKLKIDTYFIFYIFFIALSQIIVDHLQLT